MDGYHDHRVNTDFKEDFLMSLRDARSTPCSDPTYREREGDPMPPMRSVLLLALLCACGRTPTAPPKPPVAECVTVPVTLVVRNVAGDSVGTQVLILKVCQ